MAKLKDMTGKRFSRLTVLCRASNGICCGKKVTKWLCKCDCGKTIIVEGHSLRREKTKSCGCLNNEKRKLNKGVPHKHGKCKSRLYRIWSCMKRRCNPTNKEKAKWYSGRGIAVCDEWKNSFQAFYDWAIANGYEDNLSIDRIDVDGNYEPSNCRWANVYQQAVNKSGRPIEKRFIYD